MDEDEWIKRDGQKFKGVARREESRRGSVHNDYCMNFL